MKDQVHIRNPEAAQLARALAQQTGKSITEVVLDALRSYRPASRRRRSNPRRIAIWQKLLREDARHLVRRETPIEALYNESTGLPK